MIDTYELESVVGRGGTAVVWRAKHRETGQHVALKVLTAAYASEPQFREFLANEVRVVARLNHPNIAALLDAGEADRSDEAHRVVAGSPFLAMEYVPHGTLDDVIDGLDYASIRALLLSLMEALAHAHSHGVVHLDLKPGNVLLRSAGASSRVALTDFGVSRFEDAAATDDGSGAVTGTPNYMAPEQIEGKWRETGPWTDLYALGCMAYRMVAGSLPFERETNFDILAAHLEQPVPPFLPRTPVPREFLAWLGRLLEKDPRRRFQRAAHAYAALRKVRERDMIGARDAANPSGTMELHSIANGKARRVYWPAVPLPLDWRERTPSDHSVPVIGAELIRHRIPTVVGAEAERDVLWSAFTRSVSDGVQVVEVTGPSGVGRSRIAEWAGRFVDEIGAGVAIMARYRGGHGGERALENALARRFALQGLAASEALSTVRDLLAGDGEGIDEGDLLDAVLLSDMLSASRTRGLPSEERRAVLGRCLERISSHHPLVLVLDDIHESPEDQRFVEHLRDRHSSARILVLATAIDTSPLKIAADSSIALKPLSAPQVQDVVRQLVPLEPSTKGRLAAEARGIPGDAVRLVTSWADRGLLRPTALGFRIDERAMGESVGEAAERRVSALLARFGGDERRALQAAAALAPEVSVRDWLAVMRALDIEVKSDFLERAVRLGVLEREQEDRLQYVFSSVDVLRALDAEIVGRGREILHLACADELERIYGPLRLPGLQERVAKHLVQAGRYDDALALVGSAALRQHQYDAVDDSRRLLQWHAQLLPLASEEARRVERWVAEVVRLWLDERDGLPVDPEAVYEVQGLAFEAGSMIAVAEAARLRSKLLRRKSFEAATEALEEAAELIGGGGSSVGMGTFWLGIGWYRGLQGDFEVAFSHLERALRVFSDEQDHHWMAQTWRALAYLRIQQGDFARAKEALDVSVNMSRDYGDRLNLGGSYLYLGELERAQGNYRRASQHYGRALDAYVNDGSSNVAVARYNLALCELAARRYGMARGMLDNLYENGAAANAKIDDYVGIALGPVYAESRDWKKWDERFVPAARRVRRKLHAENDFAWLTELAGKLACEAGEMERARFAWALSRDLWAQIGRVAESERVAALLETHAL